MSKNSKSDKPSSITLNKKAHYDYFLEDKLEAGIALEGWEVKSLRAGQVQLNDAYVILKHGEVWLIGCLITPLMTVSTHIHPDPTRTRKLLLNHKEISKLHGSVERKGYTILPLKLYWKKGKIKLEIALAKGKKQYDKRETIKGRDWSRQKSRIMKKMAR